MRFSSMAIASLLCCTCTFLSLPKVCRAEEGKQEAKSDDAKKSDASGKPVVLCKDHGVPEDICVLCHPKLAAQYKKKGDWCKEHKVPESQCIACHPELEAKYKAMAAGKSVDDSKSDSKKSDDNKSGAKSGDDKEK